MRRLRPRPTIPLPDKHWVSSEEFRLAMGRSPYVWRRIDLPTLLTYFPPEVLGPDPIADRRWRLDDIAQRYAHLVVHLAPNTTFLDRFKQRQRIDREAYLELKKSHRGSVNWLRHFTKERRVYDSLQARCSRYGSVG
jgi:hypothetical protein